MTEGRGGAYRPVEAVGKVDKTVILCYIHLIMARYKSLTPFSQGLFLSVNLNDQLLPGSFEFTLNYLIDHSDLSRGHRGVKSRGITGQYRSSGGAGVKDGLGGRFEPGERD